MIQEVKMLSVMGDKRGKLVALQENKDIPFDVKRVFYIYDTQEGISRGYHAHYKTQQFLIAVHGSCKVTLDDAKEKKTFLLDNPTKGLFQDAMVWGEMHDFSSDCVLMVLANEYYEEADYIKDYTIFLKEAHNDT